MKEEAECGPEWTLKGSRSPGVLRPRTGRRGLCALAPEVRPSGFRRLLSTLQPLRPGLLVWLLLFNIHLEKLNLASWKPAHRVKFLADCAVFHSAPRAAVRFPLV